MFGLFLFWILLFKDVQPGLFFIRIFRVLNTVQFFIFKVHFVVAFVLSSNSFILSQLLAFVNNFFYFFQTLLKFVAAVFSGELYNIKPSNKCQQFFSIFLFFRFFLFYAAFPYFLYLPPFSFFLSPIRPTLFSPLWFSFFFAVSSIIFYRNNRCCTFS